MFRLYHLTSLLFTGFVEVVIVLAILRFVWKSRRVWWNRLFYWSNGILLCTALLHSFAFCEEIFLAWYSQVPGELDVFMDRITGRYWYTYWIMFIAPLALPQIFWVERIRRSPLASMMMIPVLCMGKLVTLFVMYSDPYHDSRPSAWAYRWPEAMELIIPFAVFSGVLGLVYFLSRKSAMRRVEKRG
jgi:molybdopterin-containing oxidoreductase family membrane subunit